MRPTYQGRLGATVQSDGTSFRVWAPEMKEVEVMIETPGRPSSSVALSRGPDGFHTGTITAMGDGDWYRYRLDGRGPYPDPASRFQPEGVHGSSQIVDWRQFKWSDSEWTGLALEDTVLYELHIGTFTPEGTFAAAAELLPYLQTLGVTALELMPLSDFAGNRNWGYDGVAPFAPARCYGRPDDLRAFVDRAHSLGLAVYLDAVYNHLGPDGAYQSVFSRFYYSEQHQSPWGAGINFDGPHSEPVRDYVIENALRWINEYHFDGLRLDATHAIVDEGNRHIVASLAAAIRTSLKDSGREAHVIAEDNRNLATMMKPETDGGWAMDGVWSDDFHHQLRRALAGDSDGYFQDFEGSAQAIAETARRGWFYTGQFAPYFGAPRGTDPTGLTAAQFTFFLQNHDQIGNRAFGDRLHHKINPAQWRAASALLLLLPETPLLFMGQEWAASTPFLYFTDHPEELGRLVTEGRRKEFSGFAAFADPTARESIPDPQSAETWRASQLQWEEKAAEPHASVERLYRHLLALRKTLKPSNGAPDIGHLSADSLFLRRTAKDGATLAMVVRLRGGAGRDCVPGIEKKLHGCEVVLTTEDAPFVPARLAPRIDSGFLAVEFARPGAVIFRLPAGLKLEARD